MRVAIWALPIAHAEDSIDLSLLKSKVRVLVTITDEREVFFRESKVLGNL